MEVLMVGTTGQYASLVTPELQQRGVTVRALVPDESWNGRRGSLRLAFESVCRRSTVSLD